MTSYDALYAALGLVVKQATGRPWWRKGGIQSQPIGTYATIFLPLGTGLQNDVVERIALDAPTNEVDANEQPWGTVKGECQVEFFRSAPNDSALDAATRFKNSLRLEARYMDLWQIMGLVGGADVLDISSLFRADIEPRARVSFQFYANIASPAPLTGSETQDIAFQTIDITHVQKGGTEFSDSVDIDNSQVPLS